MAHIIEVVRDTAAEARSFLDALFYSDFVSAIGHRPDGERIRAVAVNWDANEEGEIDERISQMVTDAIEADDDLDEIAAYRRLFPETILYQPELDGIE
jgi:hypothetical protein